MGGMWKRVPFELLVSSRGTGPESNTAGAKALVSAILDGPTKELAEKVGRGMK
jgi:hypothetical protein